MSEFEVVPRSIGWRIALTAWNVLAPGIGLMRSAGLRKALPWLLAPYLVTAAIALLSIVAPTPKFGVFVVLALILLLTWLAIIIVPAAMTWRSGAFRRVTLPWWRRWPALLALFVVCEVGSTTISPSIHHFYKPFYIPGESMMPTLLKNDRLFADMRGGRHPRRGDIVLVDCDDGKRVYRVAGLSGDRITVRADRPIVNGAAADQHDDGRTNITVLGQARTARIVAERLPGEAGLHHILILGDGPFADMDETVVPAGYLFLLGDNRDLAADSRVPMTEGGCGTVAMSAVAGRPLFVTWSRDHARIGTDLTRG